MYMLKKYSSSLYPPGVLDLPSKRLEDTDIN